MRRFWLIGLAVVVLAVLAGSVLSSDDVRRSGPAGDPRATTSSGTRAAVLLADELGYATSTGDFRSSSGTTVLFHDGLDPDDEQRLETWVRSGGTLLALGPEIDGLTPRHRGSGLISDDARCDIDELQGLRAPDVGLVPTLRVPDGAASCFGVGAGAFAVIADVGAGTVISTSSFRPFQNSRLAEGENAAVFDALLARSEGDLRFVTPFVTGVGEGDRTLTELVPEWIWVVFALGLAGGAVHMIASARRLGRPVAEPTAVEIDGAELVRATARLYERTDARQHGVELARAELRADMMRRWRGRGAPAAGAASVDQWVQRLRLHGRDADTLRHALGAPVSGDDQFVSVMAAITRARDLVAHGSDQRPARRKRPDSDDKHAGEPGPRPALDDLERT